MKLGGAATPVLEPTFRADDPDCAWHVAEGEVDLFMVAEDDRWRPLVTCRASTLIPGLEPAEFTVVGRGGPGARVERVRRDGLDAIAAEQCPEVAAAIDGWLEPILGRLSGDELPPREFLAIEAGEERRVAEGDVVRPVGGPLWVEGPGLRIRGRAGSRILTEGELAPAGQGDWLAAERETTVRAHSTADLIVSGRLWAALERIARQATRTLRVAIAREDELERQRIAERAARDAQLRGDVDRELGRLMEGAGHPRLGAAIADDAMAAMAIVGDALGVTVRRPPASAALAPRVDPLAEIVRASGLYARTVALRPRWFAEDAGHLIGFLGEERRPVALLRRARGYELHDPRDGSARRVDAAVAAELAPDGRALYRQLPDRPLGWGDLLRFGARGTRRDVVVFLLAALAVAALSLLVPIASGEILGHLIPNGEGSLVTSICLALLAAGLATLLLAAVQNLAALRVEGRLQAQIQEGIWGRVMRLSPAFFRRYAVGDLATRALAQTQIQELLSNLGIRMAVASVAAVANTALILVYSPPLGLVVVALFGLIAAIAVPAGRRSLRLQRRSFDHQREVNSRAFQLIGHVGKLRAGAAEERAFAFWAEAFAANRDALYAARRIQNRFAAFAAAFALLSFAVVFVFAGAVFDVGQGTFFVFTVAYAQAMAAVLLVVVTAIQSMPVVPLLEGVRPILEAVPEVDEGRSDPGELSGAVEVSGVTFSYRGDGPPVLADVSLSIRPGEFVAVVGPSGSGKSTLVRLMLGFEAPQAGAILYDEQDLADLDISAVRRQCGVVLQDAALFAGDILSNVVGSGVYTADDAWEAIEMVGMDREIAEMPMGMFTVLSEGAGTLSGGQRQRIAIARALVARPRIIFLDEATSALDNLTQQRVIDSMRRLQATRVVVAHRLSTIIDADRIVVMRDGRIAEQGTYDELMARDGVFRRLAERQLA